MRKPSQCSVSSYTIALGILLALMLTPRGFVRGQEPLSRFELSIPSMGSTLDLVVYASDQKQAQESMEAGLNELERLSVILSNYDANSEISKLCQAAVNSPILVSDDLKNVLLESRRWHTQSLGKFDITIGSVSKLWRTSRKQFILPSNESIELAKRGCGWEKIGWRLEEGESSNLWISRTVPETYLDLSGLATGYIIDRMFDAMVATGTSTLLINAGGDIRVGDAPPGRMGWRINVAGLGKDSPLLATYTLTNHAVTTSGDLVQFVEIDGHRYSHFIDPDSVAPIQRRQSVTAFASTAIDADAGATALAVMGMELGSATFAKMPLSRAIFMQMNEYESVIRLRYLETP